MRLEKTRKSAVELSGRFDRIVNNAQRHDYRDRFPLGNCIGVKPVINGSPRVCNDRVISGEGYADLDGSPFKAYYCASCAARRMATQVTSAS